MSWPLLLMIQMGIGALIGGMTNELAIRMLFRPYKAIYIGKWRVPFTPGLIPKRHDDLAQQMGKLVENFLITPEGVRSMLRKGQFDAEIQRWLLEKVGVCARSEETLQDLMTKWGMPLTEELGEKIKGQLVVHLSQRITQTSYLTLDELLSDELKDSLEERIADAAPFLLEKISRFLGSQEGEAMIRQMLSQLVGGLGMFGGFASMLLSDEKVISKVSASLEAALRNEELQAKLGFILQQEFKALYKKQVGEVITWMGHDKVEKALRFLVDRVIHVERIGGLKLCVLLQPVLPYIEEAVPSIVNTALSWVETHLEEGLKKINLTQIAAAQVEAFPVNKLEEMIVSITGKELRMITILGAVLGGLIGAVQAGLVYLLR
ncbi:DUF445 domain-containing protein [Ammoniphilus sp. CFH 90114]|uniref:DUF445 domain-containing protein n=1 Tax=Ammoniphilus sp. CFH 90114 TaxID=2493665 RepID=UPI00100DCFCE|nr:DUF445 family protein [Ammoniphilus sp. CFH 90114]